jgi:hypothetical protein
MTVLRGQNENAGHFLQLAAIAIGHKVIAFLLSSLFGTWPPAARGCHYGRGEAGVQTKLRTTEELRAVPVDPRHQGVIFGVSRKTYGADGTLGLQKRGLTA